MANNLKVLVVAETDFASGVGHRKRILTAVAALVQKFGKESVDMFFVVPSGLNLFRSWRRIRDIKKNYGNICGRQFFALKFDRWLPRQIQRTIESQYSDSKLLIWSEMTLSMWPFLSFARSRHIPYVVDVHGISDEALFNFSHRQNYEFNRKRESEILESASAWVVVSERMEKELRRRTQQAPDLVSVIPNTSQSFETKWVPKPPEHKFTFVYSGGVQAWQSVDDTLRLFAEIQKASRGTDLHPGFLFLTWDKNFSIEERLKKLNLSLENFEFRCLSESEVKPYLLKGDAGVVIRADNVVNHVSCPTKAAEYLMAGMPLISTPHAGDLPQIIKETGAGFVMESSHSEGERLVSWALQVKKDRVGYAERSQSAGKKYFGPDLNHKFPDVLEKIMDFERPKRITFVIPSLATGGAEKVLSQVANELAKRGHQITILSWNHGSQSSAYSLESSIQTVSLDLVGPSTSLMKAITNNFRRISILRKAIQNSQPAVVISFLNTTNIITILSLWGTRIPLVISERNNPRFDPASRVWRLLRWLAYPFADQMVVPTEDIRSYFSSGMQKKTVVIANPLSLVEVAERRKTAKLNTPFMVSMGRLDPQKGFDVLLEAFSQITAQYPDWNLVIVGEGRERKSLEDQIKQLKLENKVSMLGFVSNPQAILEKGELYIQPSRFEGFPNALAEAMMLGLPVVVSSCEGCRQIVQHEVNGLVVPTEDARRLAQAMERLIVNSEERTRLAKKGKEIINQFPMGPIIEKWIRVIQMLVSQKGQRRESGKQTAK